MKTKWTVRQALIALTALVCIGFGIAACDSASPADPDDPNNPSGNGSGKTLLGTITITPNGTVEVDEYTTTLTLSATYDGTEDGVSLGWNKDGVALGSSSPGKTTTISIPDLGKYTVTVRAEGYTPKTSEAVTVAFAPEEVDAEGFRYKKLGETSYSIIGRNGGTDFYLFIEHQV